MNKPVERMTLAEVQAELREGITTSERTPDEYARRKALWARIDASVKTHATASPSADEPDISKAGFVGYDAEGHLIHHCAVCGKEAGFGYGVSLLRNQLGTWFCKEHRPDEAEPPVSMDPLPVQPIPLNHLGQPDLQKLVAQYGGYNMIPPKAWEAWDRETADYYKRVRSRNAS